MLQFIGREDVNQYVVISYTMLVSEKAELEIEVIFLIMKICPKDELETKKILIENVFFPEKA